MTASPNSKSSYLSTNPGDQPVDVYCHFADPTQCEVSYDKDEPESWSANMDNWLYVPQGSRALYEKTEPWCYFETIKEF